MKLIRLRNRLLIEGGIVAVIVAVLFGISTFVDGYAEEATREKTTIQGQIAGIDNESNAIRAKLQRMEHSSPIYREVIAPRGLESFLLDRQKAKDILDQLQNDYLLSAVRLSIQPIVELKDDRFKKPRAQGIASDININFDALTDEEALAFLSAVKGQLPAIIKVTRFNMQRLESAARPSISGEKKPATSAQPLNDSTSAAPRESLAPQVRGEIRLTWLGFKEPAKPGTAAPPPPPPPPPGGR